MGSTSADRLLTPAIIATLDVLDLGPIDLGAAKLAVRMAQQIDDAAWSEKAADKILQHVIDAGYPADDPVHVEVDALRRKLAARLAVAELGPKLLAVLVEVGATPLARAKIAKLVPVVRGGPVRGNATLSRLVGGLGA